jgi:hypothetical protein
MRSRSLRGLHGGLKYGLPLVQMALALTLLMWSQLYTPGTSPPFQLLVSINAPVALLRAFWFRHVPHSCDGGMFIAASGMLWYWVALNICAWHERRAVCSFASKPLRLIGDSVLVGVGAFWAFVCAHEFLQGYWPHTPFGYLWDSLCIGLMSAWSLALTFFFGRDLIRCILTRSEAPAETNC